MLPLSLKFYLFRLGQAAAPILPRIEGQIADHLGLIEAALGLRPYFAGGAFTAADIQMSYPMEAFLARGGLDGRYPATLAYLARVKARPAYARAEGRGGPASAPR